MSSGMLELLATGMTRLSSLIVPKLLKPECLDEVLAELASLAVELLGADRSVVSLLEGNPPQLRPKATAVKRPELAGSLWTDPVPLKEAILFARAVESSGYAEARGPDLPPQPNSPGPRGTPAMAAVSVVMSYGGKPLGEIYMDWVSAPKVWGEDLRLLAAALGSLGGQAVANAQTVPEEQGHRTGLQLMLAVAQALARQDDPHGALRAVLRQLVEILGAQAAAYGHYKPNPGLLEFRDEAYRREEGWVRDYVGLRITVHAHSEIAVAMSSGRAVLSAPLRADLTRGGVGLGFATVLVPVRFADQTFGLLAVEWGWASGPLPDLKLLEAVGGQLGMAVHKGMSLSELRSREEELEAIMQASRLIAEHLEPVKALRTICRVILELVKADQVGVCTIDERGFFVPLAYYDRHLKDVTPNPEAALSITETPFAQLALESGHVVHIEDALTDPRVSDINRERFPTRSVSVVPLIHRGKPLGVIFVDWKEQWHVCTEEELRVLDGIAAQASTSLAHSLLHREVERRYEEFERLYRLTVQAPYRSLEETLSDVLRQMMELSGSDAGTVFLLDEARNTLVPVVDIGTDPEHCGAELALGVGVTGRAAELGHAVTESGTSASKPYNFMAAIPLLWSGRVLGAVALGKGQDGSPFTADHVRSLELFASHAAAAVAISQAMEELKEYSQRLRAVSAEGQRLAGSYTVDAVLDGAGGLAGVLPLRRMAILLGTSHDALAPARGYPGDDECQDLWSHPLALAAARLRTVQVRSGGEGAEGPMIAAPLLWRDELLGVVVIEGDRAVAMKPNCLDIAVNFSQFLALSLKNAQLFQELGRIEAAAQLERLKGDFLAFVSHELRTPLTSVVGLSELLASKEFSAEQVKGMLWEIHLHARRMAELVNQLLDSSRLEGERIAMEVQPVCLVEIAEKVIEEARGLTNSHSFELWTDENLPRAMVDRHWVSRVFHNLITNAVKYSPDGGRVVVRIGRVSASGKEGKPWLKVAVSDQGVGIPAEQRELIFEKFRRGDDEIVRRIRGTGLGLYIAKRVVEAHGGKIWVDSAPGQGSTFYFTLPGES